MSDYSSMVEEYMRNSEEIISDLEKEAAEAHQKIASVREQLEKAEADKKAKAVLQKEAAIEVAGALVGKGWMSPENLSQKINQLCADPLGVIMQLTKTASHNTGVPSMGEGVKKSGGGGISTEKLSNADKALLTKLRLM